MSGVGCCAEPFTLLHFSLSVSAYSSREERGRDGKGGIEGSDFVLVALGKTSVRYTGGCELLCFALI